MAHFYILGTLLFSVYGLLIIKWRMLQYKAIPEGALAKLVFLGSLLFDPYILSGFAGAFVSAVCWMAAMTKFDLSQAYPFVSLSYVLVILLSGLFLHEPITMPKVLGAVFIIIGIIVGSRG